MKIFLSEQDQMIFKKRVQDHFIARGLISKQFISSYNEFVTNDLVRIILAHNPVWSSESNRCMLKFSNPRLGEPDYKDETTGVCIKIDLYYYHHFHVGLVF